MTSPSCGPGAEGHSPVKDDQDHDQENPGPDPVALAEAAALLDALDISAAPPRTVGRPTKSYYVEHTRDLTEADMEALQLPRGAPAKSLQRLRSSHHALARCLATGMKHTQAALVTGYNPVTISALMNDDSFTALVADYRREASDVFGDLAERMNNMSLDAIEILQERLHEAPQDFTTSTLLDLIKTFADRTGHGPNQDINLKVSGDFIDRPPRETFEDWERRRTKELDKGGTIIDGVLEHHKDKLN